MYRHNENIKMVMMINNQDDRVMARALLWNLGEENGLDEDFKFMDRIYSTKDDQTHHFFEWAKKNGYAYKEKQSWNTPYRFQSGDDKFEKRMKINLKVNPAKFAKIINGEPNGGGGLPYLDTFKWMNMIDGTLYNYKPYDDENKRDIYTMVATNGGYYGFNYIKEDEYHKEFWYEGEVKYVPYLDKLISDRYLNWSDINDTYILKDHSIREKYINDIIFNSEYDEFNDIERISIITEEKRERERKLLEKIKKDTISSLSYFEKYVEASDPFLLGKRKTISRVNYDIGDSKPISKKKVSKFVDKERSMRNWTTSGVYITHSEGEPVQREPLQGEPVQGGSVNYHEYLSQRLNESTNLNPRELERYLELMGIGRGRLGDDNG